MSSARHEHWRIEVRISLLTLTGFRCFGPQAECVPLCDLTALVGSNGCGKSSALWALIRMFGISQSDRTLVRADFHLSAGKDWDDLTNASLRIEALLQFPELEDDGDFDDAAAACFKHMTIREPGKTPYCRIRLDGTWERSNLPEGDVEQKLWWITSPLGTDEEDEKKVPVQGHERSRIHVHYVPAMRDPARQIRHVSGSLLHTLLRAVHWSDETKREVSEASDAIRDAFAAEDGVVAIQAALEACWKELHGAPEHRQVAIRPISRKLEELIRQVEATFSPGPADKEDGIDRLSDGQRSLFYLAIVAALLDVQEMVGKSHSDAISREQLSPPILNILAVEEPENHVAPHYLGRIMTMLRRICASERGQVVLSSHSASILARVFPEEVRHLRTQLPKRTTIVRSIVLPKEVDEQHKFIREAVRAYPELYFAKLVVLGEGDSEEIVIPRLAEAKGIPIDASFVSVAPLGGRHVNHFWRLLDQLEIPHLTLLDLDRERQGGGWSRIKYAIEQLLAIGWDEGELLQIEIDGKKVSVTRKELKALGERDVTDAAGMNAWIKKLESYEVFFSKPLDLDFIMLRAFSSAYEATAETGDGPEIPEDDLEFQKERKRAIRAVLKRAGGDGETYTEDEIKAYFWYRYLFLGRGKPSTHILALSKLEDEELKNGAPKVLLRLVNKIRQGLAAAEAKGEDET
jgi:putative ATP-dependent endonuclease of the OLD family